MAQKVSAMLFVPYLPMSERAFVLRFGFGCTPTAVAVVTAVVGIPAQHVPKFRPIQRFAALQNLRRQFPRPSATGFVQFRLGQNAKMPKKNFHPRDALARAADVTALAAIGPARTGKAIVGAENDTAATENVYVGRLRAGLFQDRPADGTVADIESDLQIGLCAVGNFSLDAHGVSVIIKPCLNWNQDKVR